MGVWHEGEELELIELYENGWTITQLAEWFGKTRNAIHNKLKRMGATKTRFSEEDNPRRAAEFGFDPDAAHRHLVGEVTGTLPRIYDGQDIKPKRDYQRMPGRQTWAPGASSAATAAGK